MSYRSKQINIRKAIILGPLWSTMFYSHCPNRYLMEYKMLISILQTPMLYQSRRYIVTISNRYSIDIFKDVPKNYLLIRFIFYYYGDKPVWFVNGQILAHPRSFAIVSYSPQSTTFIVSGIISLWCSVRLGYFPS